MEIMDNNNNDMRTVLTMQKECENKLAHQILAHTSKQNIDKTAVLLMACDDAVNVLNGREQLYTNVLSSNEDKEVRGWYINAFLKEKFQDKAFQKKVYDMACPSSTVQAFVLEIRASDIVEAVKKSSTIEEFTANMEQKIEKDVKEIDAQQVFKEHWPAFWQACTEHALGIKTNIRTGHKRTNTYYYGPQKEREQ